MSNYNYEQNKFYDWLLNIDDIMFKKIYVDGTEENYINQIQPILSKLEKLLVEYDTFKFYHNKYSTSKIELIVDNVYGALAVSEDIAIKELSLLYKQTCLYIKPFKFEFELDIELIDIINLIHKTLREPTEQSLYNLTVKNDFLYQIDQDIDNIEDILKLKYNEISKKIKIYIQDIFDELDILIYDLTHDLLNKDIFKIESSYELLIDNIIIGIYEQFGDKLYYDIPTIDINYKNISIKLVCTKLKIDKYLIKLFNSESIETNLIKYCRIYFDKLEENFNELRKINLSKSLIDVQYVNTLEDVEYNYKSTMNAYYKNIVLYNELIEAGNDVYILDLGIYIKELKHNPNKDFIISKYTFLVNHYGIHNIYTKREFENKYSHIIKIYKTTNINKSVNYYIQEEIINRLFSKIIS